VPLQTLPPLPRDPTGFRSNSTLIKWNVGAMAVLTAIFAAISRF